jgi:predicted metal-dependent phosphoesterase TrpH
MKIDFHIHTYHSYDSIMKPRQILKRARKRKLDGIVVCDHNTVQGALEVARINKDPEFVVIVGAEIATNAGDITGIFLHKEIQSREVNAVIDEIRAQGGKVILNHPYKGHDLSLIDFSKIDFIEGYNSRLNTDNNQKAIQLAQQWNIPVIAGSDAHLYGEIANCWTEVKDLETLHPLKHHYMATQPIYITMSQFIKAFKRKDLKIFISATAVFIKRVTGIQ